MLLTKRLVTVVLKHSNFSKIQLFKYKYNEKLGDVYRPVSL